MYYRVRLSWENVKSQLGAYTILQNAINKCDENPGYSVFDEGGNVVHKSGDIEVVSMSYTAKLKKKVSNKHSKGQVVVVSRNRSKQWVLADGTVVPNRKDYLELTKQIYDANCVYPKAVAEKWVNEQGFDSPTGWLFWCSKYGQRAYIFKGSKGNWVLEKTYKCSTGNIKYGQGSDQGIGFNWKLWDKDRAFKGPYGTQYYNQHYTSKSGNSIHKGSVGKPATHGCIGLSKAAAIWVFDTLPVNTKVVVY